MMTEFNDVEYVKSKIETFTPKLELVSQSETLAGKDGHIFVIVKDHDRVHSVALSTHDLGDDPGTTANARFKNAVDMLLGVKK